MTTPTNELLEAVRAARKRCEVTSTGTLGTYSDGFREGAAHAYAEVERLLAAQSIRETGAGGGWIRLDDAIAVIENHHPDASFDDSQAGHIERRALLSNIIAELRAATPSGGGDAG